LVTFYQAAYHPVKNPMTAHPDYFKLAQHLAGQGKFDDMEAVIQLGIQHASEPMAAHHQASIIYLQYGFLSLAEIHIQKILSVTPGNVGARLHLAQCAHDAGEHRMARQQYQSLETDYPENPVAQRNSLTILEYDPEATDEMRYAKALEWGQKQMAWAQAQPSFIHQPASNDKNAPIRIGYVSADFCGHTVGRLLKDVITRHDRQSFQVFTYSAGKQHDAITQEIANNTCFRDVSKMSDLELAQLIHRDQIDILVDLSGHTAGSRLSAFALRPAPIQVSWLGYFATTGLPAINAVLLDDGHAPLGTERLFVERIIRLPNRFCFTPPDFVPDISPPPCLRYGYITFGSFNNTAKLNNAVIATWAEILQKVPDSRLILKWRTFNDPNLRAKLLTQFANLGITKERIELRPASPHKHMLAQYADIDIALDPFPFCGGMTTFEALWMGIPVVTLPGTRVVSRQSHAILSSIGHIEWSGQSTSDYIHIACQLAQNPQELAALRDSLRSTLANSNVTDPQYAVEQLGETYRALINEHPIAI
jgi:protein O-GlcNAc transferase